MTVAEKILARASGTAGVRAGDVVEPQIDLTISHENTSGVLRQLAATFAGTGREPGVWDPGKISIVFDHQVPPSTPEAATEQAEVRAFARAQGIGKFYDVRSDPGGVSSQVIAESGSLRPGMLIAGTDSRVTTLGAFGVAAFGVGAAAMASIWTLGTLLAWEVPLTLKVVLGGIFGQYVGPKDLALSLWQLRPASPSANIVIEFHGDLIRRMPTTGRMTLCSMAVEYGALTAIVPSDQETVRFLRTEAGIHQPLELVIPDQDAAYAETVNLSVSALEPQVGRPASPRDVCPVGEVAGTRVDQVVIGSCTNGRLEDLEVAARILRGRKVSHGTRLLVQPASSRMYRQALEKGYLADLHNAGALVLPAGCGPCSGAHLGLLGDRETALVTGNGTARGRMGSPASNVFVSSPAVAAASAMTGAITDPRKGI